MWANVHEMSDLGEATVVSVNASPSHGPLKPAQERIRLIEGIGVDGDAHRGATVQHLSRKRRQPETLNLRQVHLIGIELLERLAGEGFEVSPGEMGENVTTRGIDLLAAPLGSRLRLGPEAIVELTGLRNPCNQLDGIQGGLMAATLGRDPDGELIRKAGVMGIVVAGGKVSAGDRIELDESVAAGEPLEPV